MCKILVVDDEEEVRAAIDRRLKRDGLAVDVASGEAEAIEKLVAANPPYDIVLTDMVMESPNSGLNILQSAVGQDIFTEVIVLTAYGNVANAVECMRRGSRITFLQDNVEGTKAFAS